MQLAGSLVRNGVSPVLHQNVDNLLFLINGALQILEPTVDFQIYLIQALGISNWFAASTQSFRIFTPKLVPPPAHGLVANGRAAAFSHHELDIARIQTEVKIRPN